MRAFYLAWADDAVVLAGEDGATPIFLPQPVAEIPWGHNQVLLEKVQDPAERLWYARQTVEHGWSRNVLVVQIESRLMDRQGKAPTNFARLLPAPQSDLAQETLKDRYNFGFLTLAADAKEHDLEQGLMDHVQKFLLELGIGFALVGRQVRLTVGGQEFFLDLLFYHLKLRCYVVIELKAGDFKPGDAGQLGFYLAVVDDVMRHPDDKPSIGILLCKSRNRIVAEYALRGPNQPMGVAEWQARFVEALPADLRDALPSVEQIEAEFASAGEDEPSEGDLN